VRGGGGEDRLKVVWLCGIGRRVKLRRWRCAHAAAGVAKVVQAEVVGEEGRGREKRINQKRFARSCDSRNVSLALAPEDTGKDGASA